MKLHAKILQIMQEVEYLQKDDRVGEGRGSYKAISEEKVTETVRKSLIKNKVIILPVEQTHTRTDTPSVNYEGKPQINRLATVDVKYKIIDAETGDFEIVCSSGTGVDTQDKAVGKAMTYAYKYMMLRTFAIPTGEDPDKVSSDDFTSKNPPVIKAKKVDEEASNIQVFQIQELLKTADLDEVARKRADDILAAGMRESDYFKMLPYLQKNQKK